MDRGVTHPAVEDLRDWIHLGRDLLAHVLTPEELALSEAVLALPDEPALVFARLAWRVATVHRVPELKLPGVEEPEAALAVLQAEGLLTSEVPWPLRVQGATVAVLKAGCRRRGLPVSGRKAALQARLEQLEDWDDAPWVGLLHRQLWWRLARFATLRVHPDPSAAVLERMGRMAWVPYETTGGHVIADRQALGIFETVADHLDALTVPDALAALAWEGWPPGGLDLRRHLAHLLHRAAEELAREGAFEKAHRLADAIASLRPDDLPALRLRQALWLDRQGQVEAALPLLEEAASRAGGADALAVARSGRRLARKVGRSWPPLPPLRKAKEVRLGLRPGEGGGRRPTWRTRQGEGTIEEAVADHLEASGRRALQAEGALWRCVCGLLIADLMFAPVPGQLPVPRMSRPLDLYTPAFLERRAQAWADRRQALLAGRAEAILARHHEAYGPARMSGVRWEAWPVEDLRALAGGVSGAFWVALVERLQQQGRGVTGGLPDLLVLPGEPVRLPHAFPAKVPAELFCIEVKGPTDSLRDTQRIWHDALLAADVPVWLAKVEPRQEA